MEGSKTARDGVPSFLRNTESALRHRLRSMVWKQWKRGSTRYRKLRQRGIAAQDGAKTAGSSDGPWHLANTPALKIALSNAYFARSGFPRSRLMVRSTRRTAGCGPACPVVWQGRVGDHSPYADFFSLGMLGSQRWSCMRKLSRKFHSP